MAYLSRAGRIQLNFLRPPVLINITPRSLLPLYFYLSMLIVSQRELTNIRREAHVRMTAANFIALNKFHRLGQSFFTGRAIKPT